MRRCCLIHLKNSSTCHRLLYSAAIVNAVRTPSRPLSRRRNGLRWYCLRWHIEGWHRVLKSGCRIEALQHKTAERLKRAIAAPGNVRGLFTQTMTFEMKFVGQGQSREPAGLGSGLRR